MPGELEIIKVVINGGSFAVIVVFVLHYIFKAEPKNRDTIEKIEMGYRETVKSLNDEHRKAIEKIGQEHKETVKAITESHERLVISMLKESKEERKELMQAIAKEGDLNRQARHETAHQFQLAVAEMHELITTVKNVRQKAGSQ